MARNRIDILMRAYIRRLTGGLDGGEPGRLHRRGRGPSPGRTDRKTSGDIECGQPVAIEQKVCHVNKVAGGHGNLELAYGCRPDPVTWPDPHNPEDLGGIEYFTRKFCKNAALRCGCAPALIHICRVTSLRRHVVTIWTDHMPAQDSKR
jgi:hypothetical protein